MKAYILTLLILAAAVAALLPLNAQSATAECYCDDYCVTARDCCVPDTSYACYSGTCNGLRCVAPTPVPVPTPTPTCSVGDVKYGSSCTTSGCYSGTWKQTCQSDGKWDTGYCAANTPYNNLCSSGQTCSGGSCVCAPSCSGDQCGQSNGCGGTCPSTDKFTAGKCGNPACSPVNGFWSTCSASCGGGTQTCQAASCGGSQLCGPIGATTNCNTQACLSGLWGSCSSSSDCQSGLQCVSKTSGGKWCVDSCASYKDTSYCGDVYDDPGRYCYGNNIMCSNGKGCVSNNECISGQCIGGICTSCTDNDGDGYGNPGSSSCSKGSLTDCNDNNAAVNPGASEPVCDSDFEDNNCSGGDAPACPEYSCGPWSNCNELCTGYGYPSGVYKSGTCYCQGPEPSGLVGCAFSGSACKSFVSCAKVTSSACTGSMVTEYGSCNPSTGNWQSTPDGTQVAIYDDSSCTGQACNVPATCATNPSGCTTTMLEANKCGLGEAAHCQNECKQGTYYDSSSGKCVACLTDSHCKDLGSSSGLTLNMACLPSQKLCTWAVNVGKPGYYCDDRGGFGSIGPLFETNALGEPTEGGRAYCTTAFGGEGSFNGECIPTYSWDSSGAPKRLSYYDDSSLTSELYRCVDTHPKIDVLRPVTRLGGEASYFAIGEAYDIKLQVRDDDGDLASPNYRVWVGVSKSSSPDTPADSYTDYKYDWNSVSINNPDAKPGSCSCTWTWTDPRDSVNKCIVMMCTLDPIFDFKANSAWGETVNIVAYAWDGGS